MLQVSRALIGLVLIALLAANFFVWKNMWGTETITVRALSVGKGDALLIAWPGHAVLVDAGSDASILRALGEALPPWQRHLDALVILSPSAGAAGGTPFVLRRYRVGQLIRTEEKGTPTRETAIADAASTLSNLAITTIPRGARVYLIKDSLSLVLSASTTPGQYKVQP